MGDQDIELPHGVSVLGTERERVDHNALELGRQ